MQFINIEIKARCFHPQKVEAFLLAAHADYIGLDTQTDVYFNTERGRLKLRTGNIENNLIYYERPDIKGVKQSNFSLFPVTDAQLLKQILEQAYGIQCVVEKRRKIFFIENVKFHIDEVTGLGSFVEIECSNKAHSHLTVEYLQKQCDTYIHHFGIKEADLLTGSYSDMLMQQSLSDNNTA